jgi:hypothetical protein
MKKYVFFLGVVWLVAASGTCQQPYVPTAEQNHSFKGYFNVTDVGLLIGSPHNSHPAPFSFTTINGWHLTEQLSAGLGLGVEFLAGSYLPVFADLRYYVRNTSFSPFFMLDLGYSFAMDDDNSNVTQYYYSKPWQGNYIMPEYQARGGWLINPGFGIRNMFSDNFGVIFSVGYRNQRLFYRAENDHRLLADYNRLVMRIGILFR